MPKLMRIPDLAFWPLIAVWLLSLVAVVYWPGLSGGFFFDDFVNILEPGEIQLKSISVETMRNIWESGRAGPLGRPVSLVSFAANFYLSGFDPFYFKLTNLIIHGVNGLLLYFLTSLFARAAYPASDIRRIRALAAMVATVWAIHPVQATSVLYVVQRMTSLSSLFVLLALIFHIWARQRGKLGRVEWAGFAMAWGVFFPLAVLSKETGALFLLYLAAYEAVLHRNFLKRIDLFGASYLKLCVAGCCIFLLYALSQNAAWMRAYDTRPFTLSQRLLTESRIIWEYMDLIAMPALPDFGLYHDDFDLSTGLFAPNSTFPAIAGLLLLAVIGWMGRIKWPLVSFAIWWFLLGHSLESSIFPLELMHEHRNYLPSLGIPILLAALLQSSAMRVANYKLMAYGGILAFAIYCALLGYLRADMYGDDFRRTQIESGYRMNSVRTQYEAGAALVNMFNISHAPMLAALADKHFERVNSLDPTYKLGLVGMLQIDCLSGKPTRIAVLDELKARLSASKWVPVDRTVMHGIAEMSNTGTLCIDRKQVDGLFSAAISSKSASVEDRSVIYSDYAAYLWLGQKDYAAAREVLARAKDENVNDLLNRFNLLQLYRLLGDREGVLSLVVELNGKSLNRRDRRFYDSIKGELTLEGVLAN